MFQRLRGSKVKTCRPHPVPYVVQVMGRRNKKQEKGLSKLEKVVSCGKKRPPTDLRWLFCQVAAANCDERTRENDHQPCSLFQALPSGTEGVSLLDQQTYRQWRSLMGLQRLSHPRRLRQRTIILQPLTFPSLPGYTLSEMHTSVLELLKVFCSAFFSGMSIELATPLDLTTIPNLTSRIHSDTGRVQYLVGDLLKILERRRPRHAQCMIAVTTVDLYPSPEWNFVLGHASLTSGCGVFGFGRHFSSQFADAVPTVPQQLGQLWVLARVVSHELCHTLGMKHCYYFHCAMNESSSIEEAATQPLFLCPVCLRKLKKLLRFNIFERYNHLKAAVARMIEASQETSLKQNQQNESVESKHTQLDQESISDSLVQGAPLTNISQLLHLQQACQWLDRAKETWCAD